MSLIEIIQMSDVGKAAAFVVDFVQNEIREFARQRGLDPVVFFSDEKLKELSKKLFENDVQEVEATIDTKEYARQMRENCVKNESGNIVCSPELWEQIASIIENAIVPPCELGDTVYFESEYTHKILSDTVENIRIQGNGITVHTVANHYLWADEFLTREEAENALKERREK